MFFKLYDEDTGGARPDRLAGVRPQERAQRHTVEHFVETFLPVLVLDAPVPLADGRTAGGRPRPLGEAGEGGRGEDGQGRGPDP